MPLIEPIIRPPAEANSFLLQVTLGCSSNTCSFCAAYAGKRFSINDTSVIYADIAKGARCRPQTRKIFLLDGDALAAHNEMLIPVLRMLNTSFPHISRIASYANGYNITARSDKEIAQLYEHKLRLLYMGLESGSQKILTRCKKHSRVGEMITAVHRTQQAGIKSSIIVLLGLGGTSYSKEHVAETITAVNAMQPRYLSFLSLMIVPGTELYAQQQQNMFTPLTPIETLQEAHDIIAGLELKKTIFRSNHASNYFELEGRFPSDKEKILSALQAALNGTLPLAPDFLRRL